MQPQGRLREEERMSRRTVADALEVVRNERPGEQVVVSGRVDIAMIELPSKERTALIDVVFPELDCRVSLPTSAWFSARPETKRGRQEFDVSRLQDAVVTADGVVILSDGTPLRAVEVVPTHLPYHPSELDERILRAVIAMTKADCFRNLRDDLPQRYRDQVPDWWVLDYGRLHTIKAPQLKAIQGYIEDKYPDLKVSLQKISDALKMFGIRIPRRRRIKMAAATI